VAWASFTCPKTKVSSDKIGNYTLRANASSEEESDEKVLEEKINRLKKELAETEAKLKASKAKPESRTLRTRGDGG